MVLLEVQEIKVKSGASICGGKTTHIAKPVLTHSAPKMLGELSTSLTPYVGSQEEEQNQEFESQPCSTANAVTNQLTPQWPGFNSKARQAVIPWTNLGERNLRTRKGLDW